jgi:hypothetical protein
MAHFNGAGEQNLVVNTSAFTERATADPSFVHRDMLVRAAAEAPPFQSVVDRVEIRLSR